MPLSPRRRIVSPAAKRQRCTWRASCSMSARTRDGAQADAAQPPGVRLHGRQRGARAAGVRRPRGRGRSCGVENVGASQRGFDLGAELGKQLAECFTRVSTNCGRVPPPALDHARQQARPRLVGMRDTLTSRIRETAALSGGAIRPRSRHGSMVGRAGRPAGSLGHRHGPPWAPSSAFSLEEVGRFRAHVGERVASRATVATAARGG